MVRAPSHPEGPSRLPRALRAALVAALLPVAGLAGGPAAQAEVALIAGAHRWAGADRYSTAATVVHSSFTTSQTVYIASGANFPDALAAGPLAGKSGAPILLTGPTSLPRQTGTALSILKPSQIVILGGVGAVSAAVEESLRQFAGDVRRIGGADRFAVAAAISAQSYPVGAPVFIASGENFPDALSGAPAAARRGAPILLTRKTSLPSATLTELQRLKPSSITVLGGPGAVSDDLLPTLRGLTAGVVTRVGGADRYAVSTALAGPASQGPTTVFVAAGMGFADALSGAAAAVRAGAPVLLTGRDTIPASVKAWLQEARPSRIVVLGGPGAVSDAVYAELHGITGSTSPLPVATPWVGPSTVSQQSGFDSINPQVAVDRSGAGVVVWARNSHAYPQTYVVQARRRSAAGTWSGITSLSPAGQAAASPVVAVDDDGDAVAAWKGYDGADHHVYARRLSRNGEVGPLLTLTPGGVKGLYPDVAVDPDGDALVSWAEIHDDGSTVPVARRISSAGVLGPTIDLHEGYAAAETPQVAIDRDGDAVLAWANDNTVQGRTISAQGAVGSLLTLTGEVSPIARHTQARVAIDADGDALVTWRHMQASELGDRLLGRRVSPEGTPGTLLTLTADTVTAPVNHGVASDLEGDVVVTWSDWRTGYVYARRMSRAGSLEAPELVGLDGYRPWVAVDDDGDGVVVYSGGPLDGSGATCQARRFSSGGTWGSAQTLAGCHAEAYPAVSGTGSALIGFVGNYIDTPVRMSSSG